MRRKIESAAKKEDTGAVVFKLTEAPGIGFEGLYFGVKTLVSFISIGRQPGDPTQWIYPEIARNQTRAYTWPRVLPS